MRGKSSSGLKFVITSQLTTLAAVSANCRLAPLFWEYDDTSPCESCASRRQPTQRMEKDVSRRKTLCSECVPRNTALLASRRTHSPLKLILAASLSLSLHSLTEDEEGVLRSLDSRPPFLPDENKQIAFVPPGYAHGVVEKSRFEEAPGRFGRGHAYPADSEAFELHVDSPLVVARFETCNDAVSEQSHEDPLFVLGRQSRGVYGLEYPRSRTKRTKATSPENRVGSCVDQPPTGRQEFGRLERIWRRIQSLYFNYLVFHDSAHRLVSTHESRFAQLEQLALGGLLLRRRLRCAQRPRRSPRRHDDKCRLHEEKDHSSLYGGQLRRQECEGQVTVVGIISRRCGV